MHFYASKNQAIKQHHVSKLFLIRCLGRDVKNCSFGHFKKPDLHIKMRIKIIAKYLRFHYTTFIVRIYKILLKKLKKLKCCQFN
jgi:hypothetical protein